jgi:hypothetical protein
MTASADDDLTRSSKAAGVSLFGGVLMAISGLFQFFEGVAAVGNDKMFVAAPPYVFELNTTGWGWIHLIIGAVGVAIGVAIIASQPWAFFAGMFVIALSLIAQFMFLPYYPLWAVVVIAIDIAVIWALCTRLREDWTIP